MTNFATLGFRFESEGARTARRNLQDLERQSARTETQANRLGDASGRTDRQMRTMAGGMRLATTAAAGIAAALGTAASASMAFQSALRLDQAVGELATLLPGATAELDRMGESAREMARQFGSTQAEQIQGFYQAVSAGATEAADATALVESANRLAIGGASNLASSIDILTSATNAYAAEGLTAADASDILFTGVRAGKTTVDELSATLGRAIPAASALGVGFDQLVGATAALTTQGQSTDIAITGLSGAMSQLLNPSQQARDLAEEIGLEFSAAGVRARGFAGFMEEVVRATGGNQEQMAQLFGSIEALRAVFVLAGGGAEAFSDIMEDMADRTGAAEEAFASQADRVNQEWARAMSNASQISDDFGSGLLNVVAPAAEQVTLVLIGAEDASLALEVAMKGATVAAAGYAAVMGGQFIVTTLAATPAVRALAASIALIGPSATAATVGMRGLTVATRALMGPFGLALTAIGAVTAAWVTFDDAAGDAALAQQELNDLMREEEALANSLITSQGARVEGMIRETVARRRDIEARLEQARAERELAAAELEAARARQQQQANNGRLTLGDRVAAEQVAEAEAALQAVRNKIAQINSGIEANNANIDGLLARLGELREDEARTPPRTPHTDPVEQIELEIDILARLRNDRRYAAQVQENTLRNEARLREQNLRLTQGQRDFEMEIARLSGDSRTLERLERERQIREDIAELTAGGLNEATARDVAITRADERDSARSRGEFASSVEGGIRAGFQAVRQNGDIEAFGIAMASSFAESALDRLIEGASQGLTDLVFGQAQASAAGAAQGAAASATMAPAITGAGATAAGAMGSAILGAGSTVAAQMAAAMAAGGAAQGVGGFAKAIIGGGKAGGGRVSAGTLYEVNEFSGGGRGREYFRPDMGGTVVPLGGVGGGMRERVIERERVVVVRVSEGEMFRQTVEEIATPIAAQAGQATFNAVQEQAAMNERDQMRTLGLP